MIYVGLLQRKQIDGLVQERRNSIANALELRLFLQHPLEITTLVVDHRISLPFDISFAIVKWLDARLQE